MEILAAGESISLSLTFGAGEAITSAATLRGKALLTQRFTSTDHTIQLMVRTLSQRYRHTGYKTFYFCSAVIVSLSVGMILFYRRWYLKRLSWAREIAE